MRGLIGINCTGIDNNGRLRYMKFLFITDYLDYAYGGFEPLGVLYILSAIRTAGHDVRMIGIDFNQACETIDDWKPDFIGYGVYTGYHTQQIEMNRRLKRKYNFISVFGGPHPTFFPEMIEEEGVDVICRGEGEEAIVELINRIDKGEDYSNTENFWIKKDGRIFMNPVRPLQNDISKIAHPARDLLYRFPEVRKNKIRVVVTARGCPYACTYCYNYKIKELYKETNRKHLRHRTVDDVIEEITDIKENYPIEYIYFGTDCFTADKSWALEFAEKYREKLGIPFVCSTRPETTNAEVCEALKKANCVSFYMGIESGDEDLRRGILNRKMKNSKIVEASKHIHNAGLKLATFNMMCFPGETIEQALKTMYINQECRTDFTWVAIFQPYPRTHLAENAIKNGYFDGNFDSLPKSWYKHSALKNPKRKQLERLQKLVSIGVEFPWLTPVIKFSLNLPFDALYLFIMKLHKAFAYRFRIMPVKLGAIEVINLSWRYLFDRST